MAVESEFHRTFPAHRPESSSPSRRATWRTVEGAVVRGSARAETGRTPARIVVVHGRIGEAPPIRVTIVIVVVEIIVVVTVSSVPLQLGVTERNPNENPSEIKRTEKFDVPLLCSGGVTPFSGNDDAICYTNTAQQS